MGGPKEIPCPLPRSIPLRSRILHPQPPRSATGEKQTLAGIVAGRHPAGAKQPANLHQQGQPKDGKRMNESNQPALLELPAKERRSKTLFNPKEFKIQALRECPTPAEMQLCDTPDNAADYWRRHVVTHPYFNRDVECFVILLVNTLRKIQGHCLISTGTLDTILVHQREVFPPGGHRRRSGHCADAQSPFRRPDAQRSGHQSDSRPDTRRATAQD